MNKKLYFKCEYDEEYLIKITETKDIKNLDKKELDLSNKIDKYIKGEIKNLDVKYKLYGTTFQKKVWHEIEQIPFGEKRTYKEVATKIGNYKASRAVGMACNRNPLPIIVPCHRVIGTSGKLTGFIFGIEVKEQLLIMEKRNSNEK